MRLFILYNLQLEIINFLCTNYREGESFVQFLTPKPKKMKVLWTTVLTLALITALGQKPLHIYGGKDHEIYLGCLNCNKYDVSSIWNEYATYGSKYNSKSIWNEYGTYGGEYSSYSPFNSYSNAPPIIVDKEGNSYGYLTTNADKSDRANFSLAITICKNWKEIKDDVSSWYDKIFQ